jgi:hypothetical protein
MSIECTFPFPSTKMVEQLKTPFQLFCESYIHEKMEVGDTPDWKSIGQEWKRGEQSIRKEFTLKWLSNIDILAKKIVCKLSESDKIVYLDNYVSVVRIPGWTIDPWKRTRRDGVRIYRDMPGYYWATKLNVKKLPRGTDMSVVVSRIRCDDLLTN